MSPRALFSLRYLPFFFLVLAGVGYIALSLFRNPCGSLSQGLRNTFSRPQIGYLQIQNRAFLKAPSLAHTIGGLEGIAIAISTVPDAQSFSPRVEAPASVASGTQSLRVKLIGVEPDMAGETSGLKQRVKEGEYLRPGDSGLLLSESLARELKVRPGATVTLLSRGAKGSMGNTAVTVRGILAGEANELESPEVYFPIDSAQKLLALEEEYHRVIVRLGTTSPTHCVAESLQSHLPPDQIALPWQGVGP